MSRNRFVMWKRLLAFLTVFSAALCCVPKAFAQVTNSDWRIEYYQTGTQNSLNAFGYWWLGSYIYNQTPYHKEWNDSISYGSSNWFIGAGNPSYSYGVGLTQANLVYNFDVHDSIITKIIWDNPNSNPPATVWIEEEGFANYRVDQHSNYPE